MHDQQEQNQRHTTEDLDIAGRNPSNHAETAGQGASDHDGYGEADRDANHRQQQAHQQTARAVAWEPD